MKYFVFSVALLAGAWTMRGFGAPATMESVVEPFPGKVLQLLNERCVRMRAMQHVIHLETRALHKASPHARMSAESLAHYQKRAIDIAERVVADLREEGVAVAFPEVFEQVRDDMVLVRQRLLRGDVGGVTQEIQKDIVDTLDEMTKALTKRPHR